MKRNSISSDRQSITHLIAFSAVMMLSPLIAAAQTPGTFSTTGSMTTSRSLVNANVTGYATVMPPAEFTATLLANGKALITGGIASDGSALASAELYDPSTGTFSPTGSMNYARWSHTATLLRTGKVLIDGDAYRVQPIGVCLPDELYDPVAGTFSLTAIPPANCTSESWYYIREFGSATPLRNGLVLQLGGYDATIGSGFDTESGLYSPVSGNKSFIPNSFNAPTQEDATATVLRNGQVLIAGGNDLFDARGGSLASAWLYNPANKTFSTTGSMITDRDETAATLLPSGQVLIAGGVSYQFVSPTPSYHAKAELYNPSTGTFSATSNLIDARAAHTATLLPNQQVLFAGGYNTVTNGSPDGIFISELYNPPTGAFNTTGNLNIGRSGHTATLLNNGAVLVVGGVEDGGTPLASAELYTPVGPDVTINSPAPGATVSGTVNVSLSIPTTPSCSDPTTVWWTELLADGISVSSGYSSLTWNSGGAPVGLHTLTVFGHPCSSRSILWSTFEMVHVS
jgi:hypothetical protein